MSVGTVALAAGAAALTSALVAAASWRALVRTGNQTLGWFVLAFLLLAAKSAVKSGRAFADMPDSLLAESLFSLADLAAVALVAWPIVLRRRAA